MLLENAASRSAAAGEVFFMIRKLDHVVITTTQPEECLAFYEMLGFEARPFGNRYSLVAGDFKINVHLYNSDRSTHTLHIRPGNSDFCFEIDEPITAFQKRMQERLGAELPIVERLGARGVMQSIYLHDPDGNLVEVSSYDTPAPAGGR